MSGTDHKFVGWFEKSLDCITKETLVKEEFTPKPFAENEVDIKNYMVILGSSRYYKLTYIL